MNLAVHRNRHFRSHDIILRVGIVVGIQAEEILIGLADLVGMNGPELSIGTRVPKVEGELTRLDLDPYRPTLR